MGQGIQWIEYLTVDGAGEPSLRRVDRIHDDFASLVCSLGAAGALIRFQTKVVPQRFFETLQRVVPLMSMLGDLEKTSAEWDFWRIDWIPNSEKGLMWAAKEIPRAKADPKGDYPTDEAVGVLDWIFKHHKGGNSGPLLDNGLKAVYDLMALTYTPVRATGPLKNMLPVDRRVELRVAMAEWGFQPADLPRVLAVCRSYFKAAGWPNMPIEIELSKTDTYRMSAWNQKGPYVVKFNFMYLTQVCKTPAQKAGISTHLRGLWDRLGAAKIPFKAHWGKIKFMDQAFVKANFGWDGFAPLVRPVFMNDYLAKRFPTG